jgi:SAM-dependent methyltransferase
MEKRKLLMPKASNLFHVNDEADVENYYRALIGYVYRRRLAMGIEMLEETRYSKTLEVGYGSGVLLKTLAAMSDVVYGVDLHSKMAIVEETARREGFDVSLARGDIMKLDFPDDTFDAVICYSVLEHLSDTDAATAELARVLKPTGTAIIGFPALNRMMTLLFRLIGFPETEEHHKSGHGKVLSSCEKVMRIERIGRFPLLLPMPAALYFVCKCSKRKAYQ